ncbi:hypothetical protein Tco_1012361 [Tanacetum coccineum]
MLSYSGLSQGFWGGAMLTACYLLNRVPNKRNMITPYELWTKRKTNLNYLVVWGCRAVVRLTDPKLKTLGERGLECIFVGYAEHSKAFRFYVIEPNDSVLINFIIESRDSIFYENRFSSVPRPSLRIPNGTEDIGGSVVPEEVTEEVVQQPEPELRKSKRNRTPKAFGPGFQLYLIEGTRDEVSDQHSYCFNIENDPKIFDEAMKSQARDIFEVELLNNFCHQGSSIKGHGGGNLDSWVLAVSQLEYSRVIGCLMYAMTCTRPNIAFVVGKLSMYISNPVLEGYTNASWISNTKDNSSTSGWMTWKSRHLGVRHSMIRELITNGVISIEFVRSQQNLADHLTKGLARDLVLKSAKGMGLNSN